MNMLTVRCNYFHWNFNHYKHFVIFLAMTLFFIYSCQAMSNNGVVYKEPQRYICIIHSSGNVEKKISAAENLFIKSMHHKYHFTKRQLFQIANLLNDRSDAVVMWLSSTLGNVGYRAKFAIPELQKALKRVSCASGDLTPDAGVVYALKKLGGKVQYKQCTPVDKEFYEMKNYNSMNKHKLYNSLFSECFSNKARMKPSLRRQALSN